jgi:ubiquinone/menaquinone biosynthesis C-methylase UbiE
VTSAVVAQRAASWNDAETAAAYERFCERHSRYRRANAALVRHAKISPADSVLDVAAGTGRTASAALPVLDDRGRILCVEPSDAMREKGRARIADERVAWTAFLPPPSIRFDRILCGAAIWQLEPLSETLEQLSALLSPGGALVFNIPAQYLLEADAPGGGEDPWLVQLIASVERSEQLLVRDSSPHAMASVLEASTVTSRLERLGLRVEPWEFRWRFSQAALRDWLAIPVVSEGVFTGLPARERRRRLRDAYERVDRHSWRWERWRGWTAWRK